MIHRIPRISSIDTYTRIFQYKLLNNTLYLNKKLFFFGKTSSPLCSYCHKYDEEVIHFFCTCENTQKLWLCLTQFFQSEITFDTLTPQTAFFGFIDSDSKHFLIKNHLLLIFKMTLYKYRGQVVLSFNILLKEIKRVKEIDEKWSELNDLENNKFERKWKMIKQNI